MRVDIPAQIQRCVLEQQKCMKELERSGNWKHGGAIMGLHDWLWMECYWRRQLDGR